MPDVPALLTAEVGGARLDICVADITTLALDAIVNTGTRYYALHGDPAWGRVRDEMLERAQLALAALDLRVAGLGRQTIAREGWSAAIHWSLFKPKASLATSTLEGLMSRWTTRLI